MKDIKLQSFEHKFIKSLVIVATVAELISMIINFKIDYFFGVLTLIYAIIFFMLSLFSFKKDFNYNLLSTIALITLIVQFSTVYLYSLPSDSKIVWFLIFPIVSIVLKGSDLGAKYSIVFILVILFISFFAEISYSLRSIATIIIAYMTLFFVIYFTKIKNENNEEEITKQKIALEESLKKLKQKDELLSSQVKLAQMGEMITLIAHQWKQPLSTMSASVSSLQVQSMLNTLDANNIESELTDITTQIKYLNETITDFRDFFNPNKQKIDINLSIIIEDSIKLIGSAIESTGIKIEQKHNFNSTVAIYPNELKQVLINLIKNASDELSKDKNKDAMILIKGYEESDRLVIEVNDNAGGVPLELIDKIFEPYFSTKTDNSGTGLGLYMSKKIIEENMGGELNIHNLEDGASFRITFFIDKKDT